MANRGGQTREVVHGAYQHHAQTDPEQTGKPAERLAGEDWPGDRSGGRNGGEVLSEKIERFGGNEIDAVIHPVGGSCARVVELKLSGYPTSVKTVGARPTSAEIQLPAASASRQGISIANQSPAGDHANNRASLLVCKCRNEYYVVLNSVTMIKFYAKLFSFHLS